MFTLSSEKVMPPLYYNAYPTPPRTPTRSNKRKYSAAFGYGPFSTRLGYSTTSIAAPGVSSKSGGFVSSSTLASKRTLESKYNRLGVSIVNELGGVVDGGTSTATAGNTVAVGHANVASTTAHQMMWRAVVKALFIKVGQTLESMDDSIRGCTTGDSVQILYRLNPDFSTSNYTYSLTAGVTNYNDIALALAGTFYDLSADIEFLRISFHPLAAGEARLPWTEISMKMIVVHFMGKSTLKIQNRTLNGASGDEESVDNVPLYGRSYSGYGNGTDSKNIDASSGGLSAVTFRGDAIYGAMAKVPTERWYKDYWKRPFQQSLRNECQLEDCMFRPC